MHLQESYIIVHIRYCWSPFFSQIHIAVSLYEPHLSALSTNLERLGIDLRIPTNKNSETRLHLKREISARNAGRLKSFCTVNEIPISLKTLRQIALPLFTRVDVGVASAALGRPASRLAMLDLGVPEQLRENCRKLRDIYKDAKKHKEKIQRALESRVLPSSLKCTYKNGGFDEEQIQMLEHWVDELGENVSPCQLLSLYSELTARVLHLHAQISSRHVLPDSKRHCWRSTMS
jgi:hypothetical protein